MLIHFCPRLLTPAGFDLPCELIDIRIKEFDLHLLGGRDVVARHPLPDKRYHVACRKSGCKAVNGLLVDVEKHVPLFTVDTRWSIDAEVVLRHRVEYVVLDAEHDAVSDYMLLWCDEVPNYFLGQSTPAMQVPLMEPDARQCVADRAAGCVPPADAEVRTPAPGQRRCQPASSEP